MIMMMLDFGNEAVIRQFKHKTGKMAMVMIDIIRPRCGDILFVF